MKTKIHIPVYPLHPERICWGCNKYCPAEDMACGNDTMRAMHPIELFGYEWLEWSSSRAHRKSTGRDTDQSSRVCDFLEYILRHRT